MDCYPHHETPFSIKILGWSKGVIDRIQEKGTFGHFLAEAAGWGVCSVCAMTDLLPTTERLGKLTGHSPSPCLPVYLRYSQMSHCYSTCSTANLCLDAQQLDGWWWKWQLHKLGYRQQCISSDSQAELPAKDSWMNSKLLLGVICLLPHHFSSPLYSAEEFCSLISI